MDEILMRCEHCGWSGSQRESARHKCAPMPSAEEYLLAADLVGRLPALFLQERTRRHQSLRDVYAATGIAVSNLNRMERGVGIPGMENIVRLLLWLGGAEVNKRDKIPA